jgi:hypothetical protein
VQAICSDWSLWLPEGEITWNNHWSQGDFPLIRCFTSRLVGAVDDKLGQHCSSSAGRWPVSPTNPIVKLLTLISMKKIIWLPRASNCAIVNNH